MDPDILGYSVVIKDSMHNMLFTVNSTRSDYYFTLSCRDRTHEVCVAAWNGLGVSSYSQPVVIDHHGKECVYWKKNLICIDQYIVVTLSSPNISQFVVGVPNLFSCEALCDDSLLVTWLLNGIFLKRNIENTFSFTTRSDYIQQCLQDGENGYTENLEVVVAEGSVSPYTVQCVGHCLCRQEDLENCSARTYYSHSIYIEGSHYHSI